MLHQRQGKGKRGDFNFAPALLNCDPAHARKERSDDSPHCLLHMAGDRTGRRSCRREAPRCGAGPLNVAGDRVETR
jgi:hypothetical protein